MNSARFLGVDLEKKFVKIKTQFYYMANPKQKQKHEVVKTVKELKTPVYWVFYTFVFMQHAHELSQNNNTVLLYHNLTQLSVSMTYNNGFVLLARRRAERQYVIKSCLVSATV